MKNLFQNKKYDEAEKILKSAIEKDSPHQTLLQTLGQIYYKKENYKDAMAYFVKALEITKKRGLTPTKTLSNLLGLCERKLQKGH